MRGLCHLLFNIVVESCINRVSVSGRCPDTRQEDSIRLCMRYQGGMSECRVDVSESECQWVSASTGVVSSPDSRPNHHHSGLETLN